jgi:hypothetical protein
MRAPAQRIALSAQVWLTMRRISFDSHKIQQDPVPVKQSCASDLSGTVVWFLWCCGSYDSINNKTRLRRPMTISKPHSSCHKIPKKKTKNENKKTKNYNFIKNLEEPVIPMHQLLILDQATIALTLFFATP